MKERSPWTAWISSLLLASLLCVPVAESQSRGDEGTLGFDDVLRRHDGYVKGETPTIPQTSFSCSAQPYNPGLYADIETQCQVYHVCFEDRQESFLCGPGTNFNQRILACDFWYNFDCQSSPSFYSVNADIGKVPDSALNQGHSRTPAPQTPRPIIPRPPTQPAPGGSFPTYPRQPERPPTDVFPSYPRPEQPPSGGSYPPRVSIPPPPPPPVYPEPPIVQPPKINVPRPEPPVFRPQPRPEPPIFVPPARPEPPKVPVRPNYPSQPSGHGSGSRVPPPFQEVDDTGFQFDTYKPPKPAPLPPAKPIFPTVVSPPRVSRPPLTPTVVRQPEPSISRPRIPVHQPDYHPDANLKGEYRPPQPPRIPQPSRPVGTGYPSYPVVHKPQVPQRPVEKPVSRPTYKPPTLQQEHIEPEYIPPPPVPKQPSRPETVYIPPPPPPPAPKLPPPPPPRVDVPYIPHPLPPVQQEVTNVGPPPRRPQPPIRPSYVPPPVPQKPIEPDYINPQPPVAPSIIREQQKPANPPPSRPRVSGSGYVPPRPKPVFPPASDHPNSNIKGGPGYQQPPPQIPRFEPTRISRPSAPQGGYVPPQPVKPVTVNAVKHVEKRPSASVASGHKIPQQQRIKKPSEPVKDIYQPPIPAPIDHPRSEIKGGDYREPAPAHQPQRIKTATSISGVKTPQPQRPRAPVVVSRPQPPSVLAPTKINPVDSQLYDKPTAGRVKQPSPSVSRPVSQPRFPAPQPIDHPNANIKGGQRRPPSAPSTIYEQKTPTIQNHVQSGSGYPSPPAHVYPPKGELDQQIIHHEEYNPQRRPSSGVKTVQPKPQASHQAVHPKQPKPDYESGSSYTRGPEIYPKPEFGQPNAPYQPISTPSRSHSTKQASSSQNAITHSQNKPSYQGQPSNSAFGRPVSPSRQVPGHQPPHQPQVFPHRENPDHPNESLKGSGAYRPPPPAGFQAAASELNEQKVAPEPQPEPSSLHGDTGDV